MASREKKGGGDFVLESRHLVGLFMLLVVIFAVVFTLGYLMGRSQYDSKLRAAVGTPPDDFSSAPAAKQKAKPQHPDTGASPALIASPGSKTAAVFPGNAGGNTGKTAAAPAGSGSKPGVHSAANQPPQDPTAPPKNPDWDFYHAAEPKTTEDHLQPVKKTLEASQPAASKPSVALAKAEPQSKEIAGGKTPLLASGSIMLQVAAVQREGDAMALAQALQQKKFQAFVITPGADKYYRVQVGPYTDSQSAANARHDLESNGFKSIIKR